MTTVNFQKRYDSELLANADKLFGKLGTTTGDAIRMFLTKSVEVQGLPFELKVNNNLDKRADRVIQAMRDNGATVRGTINPNGVLVLPTDVPEEIKDWVEHG
ncbi:hypothetical protein FACS1894193_04710 [Bacilli bacterium]|nr:hypothetical protein FACS1894192_07720 [Bacilli bacterium]GHU41221.1 hypothetical protein FACS1894193_04710 [Bacilli bacterium]